MSKLYLTGYEKETVEQFMDKLQREGIATVIDVREIPLSRKNGFSKINLERLLRERGIEYYHFQELGSPRKIREELKKTGDYLRFFKEYRKHAKQEISAIKNVSTLVHSKKHSVLLCFEKDCELCHRSILASELVKLNPLLQIIPL